MFSIWLDFFLPNGTPREFLLRWRRINASFKNLGHMKGDDYKNVHFFLSQPSTVPKITQIMIYNSAVQIHTSLWLGGDRHEKIASYLLMALLFFLSTSLSLLLLLSSSLLTWVSLLLSLSLFVIAIAIAIYFNFSFPANLMHLKHFVSLYWC